MDYKSLGDLAADYGRRARDWGVGILSLVKARSESIHPMITPIVAWLITPIGRWCAIFGMLAVAWFGMAKHYEHKGASRVVAQIERKAEALNEKATQAHNAASAPGAVERVFRQYCRDCK